MFKIFYGIHCLGFEEDDSCGHEGEVIYYLNDDIVNVTRISSCPPAFLYEIPNTFSRFRKHT